MAQLQCAEVLVRGRLAKLLGNASLEHARLDLFAVPEATLGDEVVNIGEQGGDGITPDTVDAWQRDASVASLAPGRAKIAEEGRPGQRRAFAPIERGSPHGRVSFSHGVRREQPPRKGPIPAA